ncbi:MAG: serine hydrolase [Pseudomonadota bacterium]
MLKFVIRTVVLIGVLAVALGVLYHDRIERLTAVNSLFDPGKIDANFVRMPDLFFSTELSRGAGPVSVLKAGTPIAVPAGYEAWVADRAVQAVIVLRDGEIVLERYYRGTGPEDRRISWSVAKSYLSTLIGTAVDRGEIPDLDAPVTAYAPSLAGSAYDGASIRDVLQMSSGVAFNEDYFDFWSDINRMGRTLALGRSMDRFAEGIDSIAGPPGEIFRYVSIDTHVLGMVLRGATGQSVPELIEERIIAKLGLEQDGAYLTDGDGVAFVLGGLNFTARDYARFAQMVVDKGTWRGERIVSEAWLAEAMAASASTAVGDLQYGYQWWIPSDTDTSQPGHEVLALGVYGQHIYISPQENAVVVSLGADRAFQDPGILDGNIEMFRALAAAGGE